MKKISFLIPVYNSQETIELVCQKLIEQVESKSDRYSYEIILVNDCSKDNSYTICKQMATNNPKVKVINFSKNFGKHNGLMAGFRASTGDYLIGLDDDLQNPPEEMWKLVNCLEENDYDVVFGEPLKRNHNLFQKFGSFINKKMAEMLINRPKHLYMSSYFIMKRFVIDEINRYEGYCPYVEGLILRSTSNIGNVAVRHDVRAHGRSTFTLLKLLRLWLDGFTSFSIKPLRVATFTGVMLFILSSIGAMILFVRKLLEPNIQLGYTSIMISIIFFGAIQLLCVGLLGEYIGRIFICINKSPQYVVKDTINIDKDKLNY